MGQDRLYIVVNNPNEAQVTELLFVFEDDSDDEVDEITGQLESGGYPLVTVKYAFEKEFSLNTDLTQTASATMAPTKKTHSMPGWDSNNILQIG